MQGSQTDDVVDLNVGGTYYSTTRTTLCRFHDSMLAAMFSGRHELKKRADGRFFIDRDGRLFKHVLQFLRDGDLDVENLDKGLRDRLKREAGFYCLPSLEQKLAAIADEPISVFLHLYDRDSVWMTSGQHPRHLAEAARKIHASNREEAVAKLVLIYQKAGYRLVSAFGAQFYGFNVLFTKI